MIKYNTMNDKKNVIRNLSFEFALETIKYCDILIDKRKYVISKQLLKSGTSIGANIRESQYAESRQDFVHKLKIALKEAEETEYWLLLCKFSNDYPEAAELMLKIVSIKKLLTAIIMKTQKNQRQQ